MKVARSSLVLALSCALGVACENHSTAAPAKRSTASHGATSVSTDETGRYPRDITPPAGTSYPCALTALPANLPGIPEGDRAYVNRTYARVLRATQSKLVLLKALESPAAADEALREYEQKIDTLLRALREDAPPSGLESFHRDVVLAIELQLRFFRKAVPMHNAKMSSQELFALPEAHEASQRLIAAWGAMASRYPAWSEATKDSIYHHLCALDFF